MRYEQLIKWELIIDGHKGFEKLANEFVVKEAGFSVNWKPTQFTRDGNKDGIAVLYCFLPLSGQREEQIWMEAKFSLTQKTLSRYKLDSTIVSAIIEGNVKELIFVTNIEIESHVEDKIRKALTNALGFKDNNVAFFSKWTLEKWLMMNREIYARFFPNEIDIPRDFFTDLYCTDKLAFHEQSYRAFFFSEPRTDLYIGNVYSSHLKIFSPSTSTVSISPIIPGLIIKNNSFVTNRRVALKSGVNAVELCLEFEAAGVFSGPLLRIGALEISPRSIIQVTPQITEPHIETASQEVAYRDISNALQQSLKRTGFTFHKLIGSGGAGKTRLFEKLLQSRLLESKDLIVLSFTDDQFTNSRILFDAVSAILFYYLDSETVNTDFINQLRKGNTLITPYFELLIGLKNDAEQLYKAFFKYEDKYMMLFPAFAGLNFKVLLLDDLQKLDDSNRFFLNRMLAELAESSFNGFVLLCARPEFFQLSASSKFERNSVSGESLLEVTLDDVLVSIRKNGFAVPELAARIMFRDVRFNCLLLSAFIRHLEKAGGELDEAEFILSFKRFQEDDTFTKLVLSAFKRLDNDTESEALMDAIYLSNAGILPAALSPNHLKTLPKLIDLELVRYNSDGRLVPFHDLYTQIFRKKFRDRFAGNFALTGYLLSETEELKYKLETVFVNTGISIEDVVTKLQAFSDEHRFYSVIYVLESFFQSQSAPGFKSRLGDQFYFKLLFLYTRAISHTSKHVSGTDYYKRVIKETAHYYDGAIRNIRAKALSEMVNSSFEHLDLEALKNYRSELAPLLERLFKDHELKEERMEYNGCYILMREIDILSAMLLDHNEQAERDFLELDTICGHPLLIERRGVLRIRFARCLYSLNISRAISLIRSGIEDRIEATGDSNDKWVLIGNFELSFLSAATGKTPATVACEAQDKLKADLFNDYRRALNGVAALYLKTKNLEQALEVFSKEADISRSANPRYTGLRTQLLAAHEFLKGNTQKYKQYLQEQAQLFRHLGSSYRNIIDHNLSLPDSATDNPQISFAITSSFADNTFYMDLRLW
jgi:hypothetical protein